MVRKPKWVIEKETREGSERVWLYGLHAVREALENPRRRKYRLMLTQNAASRLGDHLAHLPEGLEPEISRTEHFHPPIDRLSVHQGAALEVAPLNWGGVGEYAPGSDPKGNRDILVLLDRVSDPQNTGAILRSAENFGARAVIAPRRHSAPESGALAKAASGALERLPYLRVPNLGNAMSELADQGYHLIGLDGEAEAELGAALMAADGPLALVLGSEGSGLRARTKSLCHEIARIEASGDFGSLNVSNAAAVALYAARLAREE